MKSTVSKLRENKTVILKILLILLVAYSVLAYTPQMAMGVSYTKAEYQQKVDTSTGQPKEVWKSLYEGVNFDLMPKYLTTSDLNVKKWNTVEDIFTGLEITKIMDRQVQDYYSLKSKILDSSFRNILINKIFSLRSDIKDIWWKDFDTSIKAYMSLQELQAFTINLYDLNIILNNTLSLYDYYSNIAFSHNTGNNTVTWKNITLGDLIQYRVQQFISYKGLSLNYNETRYYDYISTALSLGLFNLQDLHLNKLFSQTLIDHKDQRKN